MIEKYYEEELRYLLDSGRQFAKAHPDRARFLNIDALGDRDPYVERLFEGFAFLVARIRERLDDSFPELIQGLISLLWPALLREIPSLAIVEFKTRKGLLQETRTIEKGNELLTNPVGPESVVCKFTTTADVRMNPVSLVRLDRATDTRGRETVTFHFQLDPGVNWQKLSLSPLRLFLYAEQPTAMTIHRFMTTGVVRAEISIENGRSVHEVPAEEATAPGGFGDNESLLPHDPRAFKGYALLIDYFVYPEKFLFVDLLGFDRVPFQKEPVKNFSYSLTFSCGFPHNRPFGAESFRLNCSPAVNLFKQDLEPVALTGTQTEYRVIGDSGYPGSVEVHGIQSVTGIDRETGERYPYQPFHSFDTLGARAMRTYATHYRTVTGGRRAVFLSVGGSQLTGDAVREESLSLEGWCTNGIIPREEIREGGISKPGSGFPDYIMFSNITRPAMPFPPPEVDDYLWAFLSHLGSNYLTLSSAETLKAFLRVYDWSRSESRKRRIEAISEVRSRPVEAMAAGSVVRGIEFTVTVADAEFSDSEDLHLFGMVLKEFLSHYVTINSFLKLTFVLKPSGGRMEWDTLKGRRWPI